MKNRFLIVGTLAVSALGVLTLMMSKDATNDKSYVPRSAQIIGAWEGAAEFNHILRMNPETGEIDYNEVAKVQRGIQNMIQKKSLNTPMEWVEVGPDNFGGRTRAMLVDKDNPNILYAGGVSGGLWRSTNKGQFWEIVPGLEGGAPVSSITQLGNGTIYVGTGPGHDGIGGAGGSGFMGIGLFKSTNGLDFELVEDFKPGPSSFNTSSDWTVIDELAADPKNPTGLWIGRQGGLRYYDEATGQLTTPTMDPSFPNSRCEDVATSKDGTYILASIRAGGARGYISRDGGNTFSQMGTDTGFPSQGAVSRIEFAISPDDKNIMYASAVRSNSRLEGIYKSTDGGNSWSRIVPLGSGTAPFTIDPFATGPNHAQGNYDNAITVVPGSPHTIIVGGITIWKYEGSATTGDWREVSCWFCPKFVPVYAHADIHAFTWGPDGTLYIGTDGGVFESTDNAETYRHISRNLNTTQFYNVAYSNTNEVAGGTQDNGSILVRRFAGTSGMEGVPIMGGDGFTTDISYINPSAYIASVYYGQIRRTFDKGADWQTFSNDGDPFSFMGAWPFRSVGRLYENPNDLNSQDSILFENQTLDTLYAGDTIFVTSPNHSVLIPAILALDTMLPEQDHGCTSYDSLLAAQAGVELDCPQQKIQNTIQAMYARAGNGASGVQVTRRVFNMTTLNMQWWKLFEFPTGYTPMAVEFSTDGNHLYAVARSFGGNSEIYIVSGLNNAYKAEHADMTHAGGSDYQLTVTVSNTSGTVTDIAVDPNNPDHVIITKGGYGGSGKVLRSTNATSSSPTFTNIWNVDSELQGMPVYSACIDVTNSSNYFVGTEYGVFATGNGGTSWSEENGGLHRVPVYEIRQQWRGWEDGVSNYGKIYLGTHGRGLFISESLVLSNESEFDDLHDRKSFKPTFNVYPNPVQSIGNVQFNLKNNNANVEIYVYDLQGKIVHSERLNNLAQGEHNYELNTSSFPTGTYIMIMRAEGRKEHTKFVKM
jgi:photosystem II stability/assembly factor-like uncharacterized protein